MAKPTARRSEITSGPAGLSAAHARFARAALGIYVATAGVAIALLIGFLVTERQHEEAQLRAQLLLEADEREHHFSQHIASLVQELQRLGLRSEVDLFDQNLAPEKSLLNLSHQGSSFFNLGVAILDVNGEVVWGEPQSFLPAGASFGREPWFAVMRKTRNVRLIPVDPDRAEDAVVYVVSPIVREQAFVGALLGAIDLARGDELSGGRPRENVQTVLATATGAIVYPPTPPTFSSDASFKALFAEGAKGPASSTIDLDGSRMVVASTPVAGTDLVYLQMSDEASLFRDATTRLQTRLAFALALAVVPMLLLVALLRRSLDTFRSAEERALREGRLHLVGEAANLIAHEVKNSLNGISMAVESATDDAPARAERRSRALRELRGEIGRLSNFTTELMTFSKGIVPRKVGLDLNELVPNAASLTRDAAVDMGASVEITPADAPVRVSGDPSLLHIVVTNLIHNAIQASATTTEGEARVTVRISESDQNAIVEVRDNGPGVAADMLDRLFEPFQSGRLNGVGIGLALSKRIVIAHDGDLSLRESERGARFVVELPLEKS